MSLKTNTYDKNKVFDPADSVFVSANAGAGKTSLLTRRVLALLLHGVAPSKILCLTFTNAAAAEMANRVQAELGRWVMADDAALAASLTRLNFTPDARIMGRARSLFAAVLESPEGVRIQTLHGLCQSLLRRFPLEAGVSPHFTVMDARTAQEVMHEARQRLFSRAQHHDTELMDSLQFMSQSQGEESLHRLLDVIIEQRRAILPLFHGSIPTESAIRMVWNLLKMPQGCTAEMLLDRHFCYTDAEMSGLRSAAAQLQQGRMKTDIATGLRIAAWLERQHSRETAIEDYLDIFLTDDKGPRVSFCTKEYKADATLMDRLNAEQRRSQAYCNDMFALAVATRTTHMLHVAEALLSLYARLKTTRALMDYEDLIISANDLLARREVISWVLYKLDGGIDHLLVDEAQDTSPEQWSIVNALTHEFFAGDGRSGQDRSLFVVGDEKQSIYSFQGADPRELGKARENFTRRIQDAAGRVHPIALSHSFRSTREVLQAVDAVFAQPHAAEGLTFSDKALAHIPTREGAAGMVELWPAFLRESKAKKTPGKEREQAVPAVAEHIRLARCIADTIRGWLDNGLMLESEGRAVQPGDIMILVQNRRPLVDPLVRALKKRNVPVSGHDRMQLKDNLAVQDLMALGQCLLLPEDDLTLASLLKSPLFGLGEEELFQLAHGRGSASLWERLQALQGLSAHTSRGYQLLTDLRARADYIAPFELYSFLLEDLGGRARITGRMGEEYHEPLDEFLGLALLYECTHTPSLQGFIHWLASSESEIKRDMEQAQGCVRILTVHASKGLEAPIVILPDTVRKTPVKDMLLWYQGDGFRLPFWSESSKAEDSFCAGLRRRRNACHMAEQRRLLYVALTRARDRLYVCGAAGLQKASDDSWYGLVASGLAPIAAPFDTPWGQGMRLGAPPGHAAAAEAPATRRPADDFTFLTRSAPSEPEPPQPLAPSRLLGEEPSAPSPLDALGVYQRGSLIHRLLQYLPQLPLPQRAASARRIAAPYAAMASQDRDSAIAEAMAVIDAPEYAFLFGPGSFAEIPVAGLVSIAGRDVAVSGQIDRLYVGEKEIWVVDFKSNHTPPPSGSISGGYLRQMRLYQLLLQQIYPDRQIRCALLWTALPAITHVPQSRLDEVPASSYI